MSLTLGMSQTAVQHVREIRRRTRKQYSSEEMVRIVLSGLRGKHSIVARYTSIMSVRRHNSANTC